MIKILDKLYKSSNKISIDNQSKIVIMSDCHRGRGDEHDNFLPNKNIYLTALKYYYQENYTYIELGDGDELWEVNNSKDIINAHYNVFKQLQKFHHSNRFIMIYGNHDIFKRKQTYLSKYYYSHINPITKEEKTLLKNLKAYETLVLDYEGNNIFLLHGHQVDFFNNHLWKLTYLTIKYIWKKLEKLGLNITNHLEIYKVTSNIEKVFSKWSIHNQTILIAGHTHRPIFPKDNQSLYFNDGSCIHPNGISCIEIINGKIKLVKWIINYSHKPSISRIIISKSIPLKSYFKK